MGNFFFFFLLIVAKLTLKEMERHTKMCVPHLNGAVSFLFFLFVCESFCSTHPPTRRCVCCFYLYLYLYLFVFVFVFVFEVVDMHVMGVAYKGSF